MKVIVPDERELSVRIVEHLRARPNNPLIAAVWHGYIASLLEWGVIDGNVHSRLFKLLPRAGSMEVVEIMTGIEYADAHPELNDEVKAHAAD